MKTILEDDGSVSLCSEYDQGAGNSGWPYKCGADPYATQVGGNHYAKYAIQPTEYIIKNNLNFCEGNVIKYVTRWKDKGGVEDLKKARHYIEMLIKEASK